MRVFSAAAAIAIALVLAGCSTASEEPTMQTPTATPPPIAQLSTPETTDEASITVTVLKGLWQSASDQERADVLASAGLSEMPTDITDDLVTRLVEGATERGLDMDTADARAFLDWLTQQ